MLLRTRSLEFLQKLGWGLPGCGGGSPNLQGYSSRRKRISFFGHWVADFWGTGIWGQGGQCRDLIWGLWTSLQCEAEPWM